MYIFNNLLFSKLKPNKTINTNKTQAISFSNRYK